MIYFLWFALGISLAFLTLKSQQWSVGLIDPLKPARSKILVIGGAFLRWIIISICLFAAAQFSFMGVLVLFFSFLIARFLILVIWNQMIFSKHQLTRQNQEGR